MKKNDVVITGCPRSGTTILSQLFCKDPRILVGNEVGFYTRWENNFTNRICEVILSPDARPAFRRNRQFLLEKGIDPDIIRLLAKENNWTGKDYYNYISEKLSPEVQIFGDKMPIEYVAQLDSLAQQFPEMKFVILTRDGRSVIASQIDHWTENSLNHWTRPNIEEAEYLWLEQTKLLLDKIIDADFDRVKLVRYEYLVQNIDDTLVEISDFIGLDSPMKNNGLIQPTYTEKWKHEHPDMMDRLSTKFKTYLNLMGYY